MSAGPGPSQLGGSARKGRRQSRSSRIAQALRSVSVLISSWLPSGRGANSTWKLGRVPEGADSTRLCACALPAPSPTLFRPRRSVGTHAQTRPQPPGGGVCRAELELSCLGDEVIFGGAACVSPPFNAPTPIRRELDLGCLRFSLNGCHEVLALAQAHTDPRAHAGRARGGGWRLRTRGTGVLGGRGDGRGGDAFFRNDLEQHDQQWLLQPRRLGFGA